MAAVSDAAGTERAATLAKLAAPGPAYLEDLEESVARELHARLEARGVDADLEPMSPGTGISEWLAAEVPKWVKRGLLHPDSVGRIFGNYGLEPPPAAALPAAVPRPRRQLGAGTLLRAVLTLGAVLVGLGLILFIAANWQKIPSAVKIAGSLALSVVALHAGYHYRFRSSHPKLGAALLLIALFGIGGVVILIGQIYHVTADSYLLPLVWGALCVPVGLFLRFRVALYIASGLWLWSYWLHFEETGQLPWIYPVLLLGFLLPYGLISKDRRFHLIHLAVLMLALMTTIAAESFWQCTVLVGALIVLRLRLREPLYDWLLVAGFFLWQFAFVEHFDDLPNLLYLLPLAFFFHRASATGSNALMVANVLNTQLWLTILLLQTAQRFDLGDVAGTGVLLWLLTAGVLWFGIGKRLAGSEAWASLSTFLRFGGVALAGLMVYVLSFRFYEEQDAFYGTPLFLGATLAFGLFGLALAIPPVEREARRQKRWGLPLVLALVMASVILSFAAPPSQLFHTVLFNLILFVGAFVLMLRGHRKQSLAWYNAGIALFVLLIASRYLDTFVEFLPRSVFFVLGGLFLIAWAVFVDRQRKRALARDGGLEDA